MKTIIAIMAAVLCGALVTGCSEETPAQKAEKSLGQAAADVGKAAEVAQKDAAKKVDAAAKEAQKAADNAKK